jgi:hypothetical protein
VGLWKWVILLLTHSYLQLILLTVGCLDNIVMPKVKGQKSKGNVVCGVWCAVLGAGCWRWQLEVRGF